MFLQKKSQPFFVLDLPSCNKIISSNVYNKKTMSIGAKFRHYNTVVKPEGLYASETLSMGTRTSQPVGKKEMQTSKEDIR